MVMTEDITHKKVLLFHRNLHKKKSEIIEINEKCKHRKTLVLASPSIRH